MEVSIIKVYNSRYGQWEANARVCLHWDGVFNQGFSEEVWTDSNGVAIINHKATGEAMVYVNGMKVEKMYTPGHITVTI